MESYEAYSLSHLSPLVVVQGVGQLKEFPSEVLKESLTTKIFQNGEETLFRKQGTVPDIYEIEDLFKVWRKYHVDGSVLWDSNSTSSHLPTHPHRYKFQFVDQHYKLPKLRNSDEPSLSDEVFPIEWIQKFKSFVPCLYVSFYDLDSSSTDPLSLEKSDQELISEINTIKEQLVKRNIKFLGIVVSRRSEVDKELDDRITLIRKQTGLNNRNGLLQLTSTDSKELAQFALEVLQIIKPASIEFYSLLEKKMRKDRVRSLSSLGETESVKPLIEVKFGLKLGLINELKQQYDNGIKSFETAYENLILIFNSQTTVKDPNWSHFRLLLDISIFHIVKLYFYLEQPNVAYKKFDVHLQSVLFFTRVQGIDAKSYDVCNWLSQQYKWLAQLSDLAPVSLVPSDYSFKRDADRLTTKVLPHSGFLYLQSIDLLKRRETYANEQKDPYSHTTRSGDEYDQTLINLLTFAKLAFQKKDNVFVRSTSYVNFQIAEEYYKKQNYEKAFRFYEQSLDSLKEDDWGHLLSYLHLRLFTCSKELKKYYGSVLNLFELALIPERELNKEIKDSIRNLTNPESDFKAFLDSQGEKLVINTTADSSLDFFEGEALFRDQQVSLTKDTSFQLKLSSKLNSVLDVTILEKVFISFKGSFSPILLRHTEVETTSDVLLITLKYQEDSDSFIGEVDLSFSPFQVKIFQLTLPTKKIGSNTISAISATLTYHDYFNVKLDIPILSTPLKNRYIWFDGSKRKIVVSNDPYTVDVVPRVPDTKVEFVNQPRSAIIGERLALDLKINNEDKDVVDLELEADADGTEYHFDNNSKKLELRNLEKNKDLMYKLFIEIPNKVKSLDVKLKLTFFVDNDTEVPIYKVLRFNLLIVDPFKVHIHIHPRIREGDLPSLFTPSEDEQAVPKPPRYWLSKVSTQMIPDSGIQIIEDQLDIVCDNVQITSNENKEEFNVEEHDDKRIANHYVETRILDGHSYRNVALDITSKIKWKRKSSSIVSSYVNEPWKISLPLLDPRVLLDVEVKSPNVFKLKYLIENPTSRVFSFSTSLIDNNFFETVGEKTQNLSVLPLTRQPVEYTATLLDDSENKWCLLPTLKVYDVNYRVSLPTLSITELIQNHKSETFLRVNQ